MGEEQNLNEVDEAVAEVDMSEIPEEVKEAIGKFIEGERTKSMILGFRVACKQILQHIEPWRNPHSSHNDYKRLFKKVEEFCATALKQETTQN